MNVDDAQIITITIADRCGFRNSIEGMTISENRRKNAIPTTVLTGYEKKGAKTCLNRRNEPNFGSNLMPIFRLRHQLSPKNGILMVQLVTHPSGG
jgi:hypothetical protein